MSKIQDSEDNIVKELQNIKERLDRIHSWIASFIFLYIIFSLLYFYFMIYAR